MFRFKCSFFALQQQPNIASVQHQHRKNTKDLFVYLRCMHACMCVQQSEKKIADHFSNCHTHLPPLILLSLDYIDEQLSRDETEPRKTNCEAQTEIEETRISGFLNRFCI